MAKLSLMQKPRSENAAQATDAADALVRELCVRLWREPERLLNVRSHAVHERFEIAPHRHRQTLQLDMIDGCSGTAQSDGRATRLAGLTLMVSYPGQEHGYQLRERDAPSRVWHAKLRVSPRWPAVCQRIWPCVLTGLSGAGWLTDAMQQLTDFEMLMGDHRLWQLAALGQVLCHWPRVNRAVEFTASGASGGSGGDEAVRRAVDLVHSHLHEPLTVDDLAAAAHLSPRQFVRRFERAIGSTPHDYLTARRLVRANELLLNPRLTVAAVGEQLGFSSTATFSRWFTQQAGVTPSAYRSDPKRM